MPGRQQLLGIWMLLTGGVFFAALATLFWLDSQLNPAPPQRLGLWLLGLSPGLLLLLLGLLLEQRLFRPLRQFQVLLARLVASPDAQSDFPPSGWLQQLQPDFDHVREGWRSDRQRIHQARAEGAAEAARIRQQLEALVQLLELPLMICDAHQRLLLINPAARALFPESTVPGLGRRIQDVLPHASLVNALRQLPDDGSVRQLLLPGPSHWLRCELRRLGEGQGALIMLHDSTAELAEDLRWRRQLAALLPRLRGHAGSLGSTAEALSRVRDDTELSARFHQALEEDGRALAEGIDRLSRLLERRQLREHRLQQTWSNDLFRTLQEGLQREAIELTPVGIPVWLRVDGPTLVALLELLIRQLHRWSGVSRFDLEPLIGNGRIHLELSWQGPTPGESELSHWRTLPLFDDPLSPRVADVLDQHGSDFWSLPREGDQAALRLPLPAAERSSPPVQRRDPRPEFHDFSIADLPPPDGNLAALELGQLEMIVFDTETTGLDLRGGDRIISIGACRILQGRLLAQDSFDLLVNPERPIPPQSTAIHGLSDTDLAEAPPIEVVLPRFHQYLGQGVLVAHNAAFDLLALRLAAQGSALTFDQPVLDTLLLSRALDPSLEDHGLDALAERFALTFPPGSRHTALGDAQVTAELLLALLPRLRARGVKTLGDALALQRQIERGARG